MTESRAISLPRAIAAANPQNLKPTTAPLAIVADHLAARGESPASHRGRRLQLDFHHGLPARAAGGGAVGP